MRVWCCALMHGYCGAMLVCESRCVDGVFSVNLCRPFHYIDSIELFATMYNTRSQGLSYSLGFGVWRQAPVCMGEAVSQIETFRATLSALSDVGDLSAWETPSTPRQSTDLAICDTGFIVRPSAPNLNNLMKQSCIPV